MTPADRRMMELLDKWLTSLDLHLKYADLSDTAYAAVQPWPKHDRPTRWIVELARQKTAELKDQQESRIAMGDARFAESLELMGFLANLVGSQHVQRFIPLAEPDKERQRPTPESPPEQPAAPSKQASARPAPRSAKKAATPTAPPARPTGPALQKKVLADAVRLLKWGKKWHELAELIARIADRPPVGEIRRILRSHKAEIEMQAEGE